MPSPVSGHPPSSMQDDGRHPADRSSMPKNPLGDRNKPQARVDGTRHATDSAQRLRKLMEEHTALRNNLESAEHARRLAEQARREWVTALDALQDPVFIHDAQLRVVRANTAYARHAGMDIRETIGRHYWEIFPKTGRPLDGCNSAMEQTQCTEEIVRLDSGEEFISRAHPVYDADGTYLNSLHFLQDVTELSAAAQARLARIARDGEMRIDGQPAATLFRLVAGAAPGIETEVHAHRFRADLYRRLSTVRIDLPSLRERAEDVPALATRLLEDSCVARGLPTRTLTHAALALLGALMWPGNLAELQRAIERALTAADDAMIHVEHLLPTLQLQRAPAPFLPAGNLREARLRFEREYIATVLQHHQWRVAEAAQALGIQRPNLYRKARQLGIPVARLSE